MPSDFPGAFAGLREILRRYSTGLIVQADTPTDFTVLTPAIGPNKKPLWFGAVQSRKSAVSFHFMPLYFNPKLNEVIAAELLPRKQGKACFNFQRPDAALFAKLDEIVALGRKTWERVGFLEPGPIPRERFDAALRAGGEDPVAIAKVRAQKGKQAAVRRAATMKKRKKKSAARR